MIEFVEFKPNSCAPAKLVNKCCGLYWAGGLIKCTFGLSSPGQGCVTQTVEQASLLFEPAALVETKDTISWALREFERGTFKRLIGGNALMN
jgi:hypothetical protein